jgi:hypothetical protein
MSSLLEQAIVDAKALKEAALKNAENLVVEKYANEVRNTMQSLLEQEDESLAADPANEKPEEEIHKVVEKLPDAFIEADDKLLTINLDELDAHIHEAMSDKKVLQDDQSLEEQAPTIDEMIDEMEAAVGEIPTEQPEEVEDMPPINPRASAMPQSVDTSDTQSVGDESETAVNLTADDLEQMKMAFAQTWNGIVDDKGQMSMPPTEDSYVEEQLGPLEDGLDELIDEEINEVEIEEALRIHSTPQKTGWSDVPDSELAHLEDLALAMLQDTELAEELENTAKLKKALQKETKQNQSLIDSGKKVLEENNKLHEVIKQLQNKLEEVNVSNAKLLYINQTLESASLNERQKDHIVEAITKADSVREAKIIFETLKNSVGSVTKNKMPESLTETVTNRSSLLLAARQEKKRNEAQSPFFDRMQKLAGININNT